MKRLALIEDFAGTTMSGLLHSKLLVIGVAVGISLSASPVRADGRVIDFDSLITGPVYCSLPNAFAPDCSFSTDGFDFDAFGFELGSNPHLGDGHGGPGTINWHSGGANGPHGSPTGFVMTRAGGGLFNLKSLDTFSSLNIMPDFGSGFVDLGFFSGPQTLGLVGVSAVKFLAVGGVGFDNIHINEVPEPSLLLGLGTLALAGGTLLRRKRR